MIPAKIKRGVEHMGWVPMYLVDEHGCLLHTEPLCTIPVGDVGHSWFIDWLEKQESIIQLTDLIYHPALGEKPPWKTLPS